MKKIVNYFSTAAIAMLAFGMASCGPRAAAPTFATIDKVENMPTTTGSFEVNYSFEHLATLADAAVLAKIQQAMAAATFGAEFVKADPASSAAAFDASLAQTYSIRHDSVTVDSVDFHWDGYLKLRSRAVVVGKNLVAYTVDRSEDNGGAHGMTTQMNSTYDLRTGAKLTLNDLFTPEAKSALGDMIRAQILRDKSLSSWDELTSRECYNPAADVQPTENFVLTDIDITFVYNPYDIACYAAGATRVTLPLASLTGFKNSILL